MGIPQKNSVTRYTTAILGKLKLLVIYPWVVSDHFVFAKLVPADSASHSADTVQRENIFWFPPPILGEMIQDWLICVKSVEATR